MEERVDVRALVKTAIDIAHADARSAQGLDTLAALPAVAGDRVQLQAAFIQLIFNLRGETGGSGRLRAVGRKVCVDTGHSDLEPGNYVRITICRETGEGGKGSPSPPRKTVADMDVIRLSVSRSIVRAAGGSIATSFSTCAGMKYTVFLPVAGNDESGHPER